MTLSMSPTELGTPVEHLGYDETHPKTWRKGTTCAQCTKYVEGKKALHGGAKMGFNISRLKADNAGGYTQRELAKEITDSARATGTDIQRAR